MPDEEFILVSRRKKRKYRAPISSTSVSSYKNIEEIDIDCDTLLR